MDARELRIGNYLNFEVNFPETGPEEFTGGQVTAIEADCVYLKEIKIPDLEQLRPIPLTEEWFLNFGLERSFGGYYPSGFNFGFEIDGEELRVNFHKYTVCILPAYVHHLQNFVYAASLQELELNNAQ